MRKVDEFTVKRSKWVNGNTIDDTNPSYLLNEKGNMCCVGFYAKACGLNDSDILNVTTLKDIDSAMQRRLAYEHIYFHNDSVVDFAHEKPLSLAERENILIEKFGLLGITIRFED